MQRKNDLTLATLDELVIASKLSVALQMSPYRYFRFTDEEITEVERQADLFIYLRSKNYPVPDDEHQKGGVP